MGLGLWALLVAMPPAPVAPTSSLEERAKAALSATSGRVKAPGLKEPVNVVRDTWGVAHVFAESTHDLFFAQGFVAAQDRLFQMELWKRAGQGRLAEILGVSALPRDVNARLLRYRGSMEAEWASYGPGTREIVTAFTDGINANIGSRGNALPMEFELAGFRPEPWKPEDCLSRMAGWPLAGNAVAELWHAQLVDALGVEKAARLLDLDPKVALDPAPGLDLSGFSPDLLRDLVGSDARVDLAGSNNWAVSGKLTVSGKPLLANDPHRTMALPSLRYVIHLVAPGWNVIGAGEPALPGVAAGHNRRVAWGFTVFPVDQQDLYVETLDPENPERFLTPEGFQPMRVERETIRIKGGLEVEARLRFTRHGPVLWMDAAKRRALALRWVGSEPGTAGYLGSLALDRAEDWGQFVAALERWKLPPENFAYADTAGNIGGQSAGLTPIRTSWTGLLPVPGAGGDEWNGFVPYSELPRVLNPAQGFYATANDRTIRDGFPYRVGFQWAAPFRIRRIREILGSARDKKVKLAPIDMARLQNDVLSLHARDFIRLLTTTTLSGDPNVELLTTWGGFLLPDSEPATLYEVWLDEIKRAVVARAFPEALRTSAAMRPFPALLRLLSEPDGDLFGDPPAAGRDRMLKETLDAAVARVKKLRAESPTGKIPWGTLHTMRFRHALDRVPNAEALFDPPAVSRPGDGTTVNATGFSNQGFAQVSGASFREVLDLSDWDLSLAINVPGQSGEPGSPHYADLLGRWSEGGYFPLLYSTGAVLLTAKERMVLEP